MNVRNLSIMDKRSFRVAYSRFLACSAAMAFALGAGCMTANPDTFSNELRTWVPLGTSVEDATRTMVKHGFQCHTESRSAVHPEHGPSIVCSRENRFYNRWWTVIIFLREGKVIGFNPPMIMGGPLRPARGAHF